MATQTLNILNERLAHVMPKLSAQEFANLTVSLRENGCLSPIIIWDNTIIDGHSRYKICREYNIPFTTKEISFNNDAEAIAWIVEFHISRRNLSRFQRCELVLRYEPEIKVAVARRKSLTISQIRKTGIRPEGANKDTLSILADMADVSRSILAEARKILEVGDEETKRRLRAGEISINYAYNSLNLKLSTPESIMESIPDHEPAALTAEDAEDTAALTAKLLSINKTVTAANENVKRLIELVEAGDAAPNVILQELRMLNGLLEERIGLR